MSGTTHALNGRTVLIAGASSASGTACARSFTAAGATVVAVGTHQERLEAAMQDIPGVRMEQCDLTDRKAVDTLRKVLAEDGCRVDGVVHLVGGWRGGKGITGQTDEDWDVLHRQILTTLRNVTRAFYDDVQTSPYGRYAIVSATAVTSPTAGGASYAATKAAAETWLMAMAQGLSRAQSKNKNNPVEQHSAAAALVVKALLDERMLAAEPDKEFSGYTHVDELAQAMVRFFTEPATESNGQRIPLVSRQ